MRIPRPVRPLAAVLVLGAGVLAGCGDSGADPASIERLDALNDRIEELEARVAELQDAAEADAEAEAEEDAEAEAEG